MSSAMNSSKSGCWAHSTTNKTTDSSKAALQSKLKPFSKAILQILQSKAVLQSKLKPILHQSARVSGPGGPRVAEETPRGSTPATFPSHSPCFSLFLSTLLAVIVVLRKWSFQSSTLFSDTLTFLPLDIWMQRTRHVSTEKYTPSPLKILSTWFLVFGFDFWILGARTCVPASKVLSSLSPNLLLVPLQSQSQNTSTVSRLNYFLT